MSHQAANWRKFFSAGAVAESIISHHVHVHLPYLLPAQIGPADLTVWLQPGMAYEVEYRAPVWAYARGALGPAPQPWNGQGCMIALLVIAGGGLLLLFLLILITALSLS
ncbi:hypothetical protein E1294_47870 [Nonomuraea diastatica]|uniref:Uncharacterized protein n=1 Tax=Nonomuraea diastatica TaxID=1848329 RepID=A0A4R4VPZ3_9ACTN|nr:hypothetical protein E1294_47870 [Nonomuraea diastatica]